MSSLSLLACAGAAARQEPSNGNGGGMSACEEELAYDLATDDDTHHDKVKKRLMKNRLSAERQRKAAEIESLLAENALLRAEKREMATKMQRMAELMAAHGLAQADSKGSSYRPRIRGLSYQHTKAAAGEAQEGSGASQDSAARVIPLTFRG